jgi:hypothetical protein
MIRKKMIGDQIFLLEIACIIGTELKESWPHCSLAQTQSQQTGRWPSPMKVTGQPLLGTCAQMYAYGQGSIPSPGEGRECLLSIFIAF